MRFMLLTKPDFPKYNMNASNNGRIPVLHDNTIRKNNDIERHTADTIV